MTADRRYIVALIAFEAVLLHGYYVQELAWHHPENSDQAGILFESYQLESLVRLNGLRELLIDLWGRHHLNGLLLPVEGALAGLLFGAARLPRLGINFAAFAALQIVIFSTVLRLTLRRDLAYAAVGLLLCEYTLWLGTGGLFDFRIDFLAYCLYGIWLCVALQSGIFLHRRGAIGCGLIGALLVLNRFIAVIYILGVLSGLLAVCLVGLIAMRRVPAAALRLRSRMLNIVFSAGVTVGICAPFLFRNLNSIFGYYVVGHLLGDERFFRAKEQGVNTIIEHLTYYPRSVLFSHLGPWFVVAAIVLAIGAAIGSLHSARRREPTADPESLLLEPLLLLGAIVGPTLVLTADISKSPAVGGIVGVPVVLLLVLLVARVPLSPVRAAAASACSLLVLALGVAHIFAQASHHRPEFKQRADLERLVDLSLWLMQVAQDNAWRKPLLSVDMISSSLAAAPIAATIFERTGQFINFRLALGNDMMGVERAKALDMISKSDIVILTSNPKPGIYPFNRAIAAYWGDLKAWSDQNLILSKVQRFDELDATIYVRPNARVRGISGDWLLHTGAWVGVPRSTLRKFPIVELTGAALPGALPRLPAVAATVDSAGGQQSIPATLRSLTDRYVIEIDASGLPTDGPELVRIDLAFDAFFVPKQLGINLDERELVMMAPAQVRVMRAVR